MKITCLFEEVLNEPFGPLKTIISGNNNNKNVTNLPHISLSNRQNNNSNNQKRMNEDNQQGKKEKLICPIRKHKHLGECLTNSMKGFTLGEKVI